jgi:predicted aldo/keto reductase-like oxidoreductase
MTSRRDFLSASLAAPALAAAAPSALEYRTLGRTGLKVGRLGYGALITTDHSVVARALDLGINYFDTAREYQNGNNERMVGVALGARRKDVVLSTKFDANHNLDKNGAMAELETSLKALNTDYVDVWYLHARDKVSEIADGLVEAQLVAKRQGKVRFLGVSTHEPETLVPAILRRGVFDVVMLNYNFTVERGVERAIQALAKANLGIVIMKPMAAGQDLRKRKKPGIFAAALKWVARNPHFSTVIPSMKDRDQLEENFAAMFEKFSPADERLLQARLEEIRPYQCRWCGQCSGQCPYGVPVKAVLRYVNYAEGYGEFALGREQFLKLPAEMRRQCGDCPSCTVHCPNGVHVADRLARSRELFT